MQRAGGDCARQHMHVLADHRQTTTVSHLRRSMTDKHDRPQLYRFLVKSTRTHRQSKQLDRRRGGSATLIVIQLDHARSIIQASRPRTGNESVAHLPAQAPPGATCCNHLPHWRRGRGANMYRQGASSAASTHSCCPGGFGSPVHVGRAGHRELPEESAVLLGPCRLFCYVLVIQDPDGLPLRGRYDQTPVST